MKIQHGSTYSPPSDEQSTSFEEKYKGMKIKDLAQAFKDMKEEHEARKKHASAAFHEWNYVRFLIPSVMEDMGASTMKLDGIGRVQVSSQMSVKQVDSDALAQWMKEHDHGDMVKGTINSSSLSSFIASQISAGEEIPDEEIITINPYEVGSVVKA